MRWERLLTPADEPLTLQQTKNHLRLDTDEDDEDVQDLIKEAREWCENHTGRAFGEQVWQLIVNTPVRHPSLAVYEEGITFPIQMPRPTFLRLEEIVATMQDGSLLTLNLSEFYVVGNDPGELYHPLPLTAGVSRIVVRYRTGQEAPAQVKRAMRLLIAHWYENRGATTTANSDLREPAFGVTDILDPLREMRL